MRVLPKLFKLLPWVDLDPFYAKVKFGHIDFCMGKSENYLFFGNYCSHNSSDSGIEADRSAEIVQTQIRLLLMSSLIRVNAVDLFGAASFWQIATE